MIHATAIIHSQAKLGANVRVGPYAVIDATVEVGADCVIGPHVYLTGVTQIGSGNQFHAGCVIGDAPQDLKYQGAPTRVVIGDQNVFREHVTVHRSAKTTSATVIGSHNFFMASAHIAHDCRVGNQVIMANGSMLGGDAVVEDRAFISGSCLVHQFCRVGTLSIMQGGAAVSQDLPPFTIALRVNEMCGLNTIGLRRAGFPAAERLELKQLYHALFRSGKSLRVAVEEARQIFSSPGAQRMLEFIATTKRGVCSDAGKAHNQPEEK